MASLSFPVPDQNSGAAAKVLFGRYPGRVNGCGWIAVCNALRLCDMPFEAEKVIAALSKRLPFRGRFGAMPWRVSSVLRSFGLRVSASARVKRGLASLQKGDTAIVMGKNAGAPEWHYFALRALGEGSFELFNAGPARGGYEDLRRLYRMFRIWRIQKQTDAFHYDIIPIE